MRRSCFPCSLRPAYDGLMPLTEEPLDAWICRPLSKAIVAALHPTGMTANQITVVAALVGVTGGAAVGVGRRDWTIAGAALLVLFMILDCADGEMARRRGGGSRLGQVLDGISDYLVAISVHVGLLIVALRLPYSAWIALVVVAAAGLCNALHSARFDAAKARFRLGLGQNVYALESHDALVAELQAAKTWRDRFVLRLYIPYVSFQRGVGAGAGAIGQREFLAWCVLGPTMRMSIIVLALVGSLWDARSLFVYPAFGIVAGNLWLAGLTLTSRRS
jgi:phosphatidylglycerophosphate synthase